MDKSLYTDEFRTFKFLQFSPSAVDYYKKTTKILNGIRPEDQVDNPDFVWKCRVEFVEQLMDFRDSSLHIVEQPSPSSSQVTFKNELILQYEDARIYTLDNPVIFYGHPLMPATRRLAEGSDIPEIEDEDRIPKYYLCSEEYMISVNLLDSRIFPIYHPGLIRSATIENSLFTAIFYDKEWAEKFQKALTKYFRKNSSTSSAL